MYQFRTIKNERFFKKLTSEWLADNRGVQFSMRNRVLNFFRLPSKFCKIKFFNYILHQIVANGVHWAYTIGFFLDFVLKNE